MKATYSIGEVSKLLDISIKALRHYDEIGLLKPSYTDPRSSYRYYSHDQFFCIDLIKYLNKSLYVPLEEIKYLLDEHKDFHALLEFLENHKHIMDQKIRDYQYSRDMLGSIIDNVKQRNTRMETDDIFEQYFLRRKVYYTEANVNHYEVDKVIKRNAGRALSDEATVDDNFCFIYSCKQYEDKHELLVNKFGTISDNELPGKPYYILPEGRYLSCIFRYSETDSIRYFEKIYRYVQEHHIPISDTVYQTFKMIDLSAFSKYDYKMEIQVLRKDI